MQILKILSVSILILVLASSALAQPSKLGAFSHAPKLFGRAHRTVNFAKKKTPKQRTPAFAARKRFL